VVNKEKIYTYVLSTVMVVMLFAMANVMEDTNKNNDKEVWSPYEENYELYSNNVQVNE